MLFLHDCFYMFVRQRETSVYFKCRSSDNSTLQACLGGFECLNCGQFVYFADRSSGGGGAARIHQREKHALPQGTSNTPAVVLLVQEHLLFGSKE